MPDFLSLSVGSRARFPFRGLRRIHQFESDSAGANQLLEITEVVGSDGGGEYTIELVDIVALPTRFDRSLYEVQHARSVDVFWSKRDFHIQDIDLAVRNYGITHLPDTTEVAGIVCEQVEFKQYVPTSDRPGHYVVEFDPATGFVLAWTELDSGGAVLASSAYETFSYRPSLGGLTLSEASFVGTPLDHVAGSLNDQAGFSVLMPDLLPTGYEIHRVETFVVPTDLIQTGDSLLPPGSWVRMHATDGIESLSFAHAESSNDSRSMGGDQLRVVKQGSWDYGFGHVSGVAFIVAGRVTTNALRQLVESAIR